MSDSYAAIRDAPNYMTTGTFMTAVGTLIPGVAGKVIKVHQYTISAQGTICYNLMDRIPLAGGGTVDYGGYLNGGVIASPSSTTVKPFVPYPAYLCKTITAGSALCLGTYVTAGALGTVYFQALYTASDSS
jgi:hypothetical protein